VTALVQESPRQVYGRLADGYRYLRSDRQSQRDDALTQTLIRAEA
jgi:hypothetical protein